MKPGVLAAATAAAVAGAWPCHAFQAAPLGGGGAPVGAAARRGAPALASPFGCRIRNAAAPPSLRPARPCGGQRTAKRADAGEGGDENAKEAEVTMGAVLSRMGLVRLGILGAALFWLLLRVVDGVGILGAQLPGPLARSWRVQVTSMPNRLHVPNRPHASNVCRVLCMRPCVRPRCQDARRGRHAERALAAGTARHAWGPTPYTLRNCCLPRLFLAF